MKIKVHKPKRTKWINELVLLACSHQKWINELVFLAISHHHPPNYTKEMELFVYMSQAQYSVSDVTHCYTVSNRAFEKLSAQKPPFGATLETNKFGGTKMVRSLT